MVSPKRRRRRGAKHDRFVRRVLDFQKSHPTMSFTRIARHRNFRVSPSYISMVCAKAGIKSPFPARAMPVGMYSGVTADQIVQAFQELGSSKLAAERLNLTRSYVNHVVQVKGIRTKRQPRPYDLQGAKLRYETGEPFEDIARDLKIGAHRLRYELEGIGVVIRSTTDHMKKWHADRKQKLAEVDALRIQVEQGNAATARLREIEEERRPVLVGTNRIVMNKPGPKLDVERAAFVCDLRDNKGLRWDAILERVQEHFHCQTSTQALKDLRRRYLALQKKDAN
jgi:hypothetical protein